MQPQLRTSPTPAVSSPHFIEAFPGALSPEACRSIIARFDADSRSFPSRTQSRLVPLIRSGTMLNAAELPEWLDVLREVERAIRRHLPIYAAKYPAFQHLARPENHIISPALLERNLRVVAGMQYQAPHINIAKYRGHVDLSTRGHHIRRVFSRRRHLLQVVEPPHLLESGARHEP